MPDPSPPNAPAAPPADPLRIVLFGLPGAGKSSLLGALAQAAQAQEHLLNGRLTDLSHGLAELRQRLYDEQARRTAEEVVPYPVDFEPFRPADKGSAEHLGAVVIDCDGRVANDLLVRRQDIPEDSPEGTLAHEVIEADTLVLVIDASAPPEQVDADFAEFDRFLRQMENSRGRRAEVGGLPVFLVLTKCDLLAQPGDTAGAWMERIEQRKREVDERFHAYLARRRSEPGPMPFGKVHLHLWATAVKRPALAGTPARAREPYGVAELFRQCIDQAAAFRASRRQAQRRLLWTVGGSVGVVAAMAGLALGLVLKSDRVPSPLEGKVEMIRFDDRATPAERLQKSAASLRQRLGYLAEIRRDPGFADLPEDQRQLVIERMAELESYLAYLTRLQEAPRPGAARSEKALEALDTRLREGDLKLPLADWSATEAGRLHEDRLSQVKGLLKAADTAHDWYRDTGREATRLWTFADRPEGPDGAGVNWRTWSAEVDKLLAAAGKPPFEPTEELPGVPGPVTYAPVLHFARVVEDAADLAAKTRRLRRVLDLASALGLVDATPERPAVLVIPRNIALAEAGKRLEELRKAYPRYKEEFRPEGLPEAIAPKVRQQAGTSYEYLLVPARAAVLRHLQEASGKGETAARWDEVRKWLQAPKELAAWRELATVLAHLHDKDAGDPVNELAGFLERPRFPIEFRRVTLVVPDDLSAQPAPNASFEVYHNTVEKPALSFEPVGDGKRDARRRVWEYPFRLAEGQRIIFQPGDRLWATLRLRDDKRLTWALSRSGLYEFEALRRAPRLHKRDERPRDGTLEEGIRLEFLPPDGVPRVPALMPVVVLRP